MCVEGSYAEAAAGEVFAETVDLVEVGWGDVRCRIEGEDRSERDVSCTGGAVNGHCIHLINHEMNSPLPAKSHHSHQHVFCITPPQGIMRVT